MTPPTTDTSREERFFIRKNGAYYRPNSRGYTTSAISAGRYTQEEAEKITHPNGPDGPRDGMSYIAEHICPDEDWQEYRAVCAERDALRDQLAAARNEALEEIEQAVSALIAKNPTGAGCEDELLLVLTTIATIKSTTPAPREGYKKAQDGDCFYDAKGWVKHERVEGVWVKSPNDPREVTVQEEQSDG